MKSIPIKTLTDLIRVNYNQYRDLYGEDYTNYTVKAFGKDKYIGEECVINETKYPKESELTIK